jgi:hypothetical protein
MRRSLHFFTSPVCRQRDSIRRICVLLIAVKASMSPMPMRGAIRTIAQARSSETSLPCMFSVMAGTENGYTKNDCFLVVHSAMFLYCSDNYRRMSYVYIYFILMLAGCSIFLIRDMASLELPFPKDSLPARSFGPLRLIQNTPCICIYPHPR